MESASYLFPGFAFAFLLPFLRQIPLYFFPFRADIWLARFSPFLLFVCFSRMVFSLSSFAFCFFAPFLLPRLLFFPFFIFFCFSKTKTPFFFFRILFFVSLRPLLNPPSRFPCSSPKPSFSIFLSPYFLISFPKAPAFFRLFHKLPS